MQESGKKKSSSKKETGVKEKSLNFVLLIPTVALMAIIPMIAYLHKYKTGLDQYNWYSSYTDATDFFLYWKMVWINVTSVVTLLLMIFVYFAEEMKFTWTRELVPIAVYAGCCFISALFSINSHYSFNGIYEQFESVWTLLSYSLMLYYAFSLCQYRTSIKRLTWCFAGGMALMTALGLSQVFRHDFFRTDAGLKYMTPSSYDGGPLTFNFEVGRPYLTLYNPNYIGFYVALSVPVLIGLFFASRKIWQKLICAFLAVSLMIILFASQSRAGIFAVAVGVLILLIIMRRYFIKNKLSIVALIILIILVAGSFVVANRLSNNMLITRIKEVFSFTKDTTQLKDIVTDHDDIKVYYGDNTLTMSVTQDEAGNDIFRLTDQDGKEIPFTTDNTTAECTIGDQRFPFTFFSIRSDSFNGFELIIDGNPYPFSSLMGSDGIEYYGGGGSHFKLKRHSNNVPFLKDHFKFANMRGYIWARTIPLLKKYFLFGSGPDTFIIAFPNDDVVGLNNSGHVNEIITKPHEFYLQVGVQTGVPSLIALLVLFIWYIIDSFRCYWSSRYDDKDGIAFLGAGYMAGVIGYLFHALTNDSCTATAPIFWCALGIGLGINHFVRTNGLLPLKKVKKAKASAGGNSQAEISAGPDVGKADDAKTGPVKTKAENKSDEAIDADKAADKDTASSGISGPSDKEDADNGESSQAEKTSGSSSKKKKRR
ncbi:MAG: O-antigen ligase family protein [Lachnospiraceae bacterium]|nr:O-antigen ligase family protein [Lachnospiraceae bacterium]MEE3461048.1 O-antigen ligase family protein [Lachnospiraceae bacterium]